MAGTDNTYHIDDIDDLEEIAVNATPANFAAARDYVFRLLQNNGVHGALMGGYSLSLRGNPRRTFDIDVAVQATMLTTQRIIKNEQRLLRPRGPAADVLRIFVKTGQPHDNSGDHMQLVEVDLLIGGSLGGSGSNAGLENFSVAGRQIPMYDIPTMMRSKLKAFNDRQGDNDMKDIEWLVKCHTQTINNVRNELNYEHRESFLEVYIAVRGEGEDVDRMKQVLGVTWPPEE